MPRPALEVVHVGSASRDIAPDDRRGWRLGGGVMYASLTTARLGLRTAALIGVDGQAASASELEMLRDAGVEIRLAELAEGPVFENIERPGGRVQICHARGVRLPSVAIPARWLAAQAWSVVPVADELPLALEEWIPFEALVTLGWQGLLRTLRPGQRVRRRAPRAESLVVRADLVGLSRDDVPEHVTVRDLSACLGDGARLCISDGRHGGRLVRVASGAPVEVRRYAAIPSSAETDATGAGDTFLATLLATAVPHRSPAVPHRSPGVVAPRLPVAWPTQGDLALATAAGSLAVEGVGLSGVPERAAVLARLATVSDDIGGA